MSRWRARIRRLVIALLAPVHHVLQHLVPPRSTQVAWRSTPNYGDNAFHLYRHMLLTRPGLEHCWLVDDTAIRDRIIDDLAAWSGQIQANTVRVVAAQSLRGYWTFLRSRHVFHTQGVFRWARTAVRRDVVSLWHGMPIKAIEALYPGARPDPAFGTLHLAMSEAYRQVMADAFEVRPQQVLLAQLPRCDVLTDPSPLAADRKRIRDELGIPDDKHLVLWMPTFRTPENFHIRPPGITGFRTFLDDLPPGLWEAIDECAGRAGCHVVLKLHRGDPLASSDFDPRREWGLRHVRYVPRSDWARLQADLHVDLYDVLAVTDGLISDISSVMIDWLLTTKPMGMVGFDPTTFVRDTLIDVSRFRASDRVHDLAGPAELEDFFARIAQARDACEDLALNDWLCRSDLGSGCEAVLSAVGR